MIRPNLIDIFNKSPIFIKFESEGTSQGTISYKAIQCF